MLFSYKLNKLISIIKNAVFLSGFSRKLHLLQNRQRHWPFEIQQINFLLWTQLYYGI